MARIRSIKPEFFRHEALYEAEQETGLPLRLAFAGMWTAADREGRFEWKPRQLKLDCLPYDDVDFSRVLDALMTRGFIVKYECAGKELGCIPGWNKHQVINNREKPSDIPPPSDINDLTRAARVGDESGTPLGNAQVEGKGKEHGREGKGEGETRARDLPVRVELTPMTIDFALSDADSDFAHEIGMTDAIVNAELSKFIARKMSRKEVSADWAAEWRLWCHRWREMNPKATEPPAPCDDSTVDWDKQLGRFRRGLPWNVPIWGPEPGHGGCRAPPVLLAKHGYQTVAA